MPASVNFNQPLENAVNKSLETALDLYLSSAVADRDALTRLQDRIHHILILAAKVPDALKETETAHNENQKAQADASKAAQTKDQPKPQPSQR